MRGAQLKNRSWLLYLIIIFLYSCEDNDDKISANLPELKKTFISISGSTGLYDAVTFNIGGTEYIGLGWNNIMGDNLHFSKYSPNFHEWEMIESVYPGKPRYGAVAFVIEGKAYVGLGYMLSHNVHEVYDDFFVYDTLTRNWEKLSFQFPGKARRGAVAFSIGGKGYVGTGTVNPGLPGDEEYLADFYEFDPQIGWKQISNISYPRYGATAFVAEGSGYVCFGNLYGGVSRECGIQKFDPNTGKWTGLPVCYEDGEFGRLLSRSGVKSFVLNKGGHDYVYIFGGLTSPSDKTLGWGYNPSKNIWKSVDYPVGGDYGFTIGEYGYAMSTGNGGGAFEAYIFRAID